MCVCVAPGTTAELTLLKKSRVRLCRIDYLADAGYQGLEKLYKRVTTPKRKPPSRNGIVRTLTKAEKRANRALNRQRVKVEHCFGWIKVFHILSAVYRNRRRRFSLRWHLLAGLHNAQLEIANREKGSQAANANAN